MVANQVKVNFDNTPHAQIVRFNSVMRVTTNNHADLKNRDAPDQHPIRAITDLEKQLSKKIGTEDFLSNTEIEELLGGQ